MSTHQQMSELRRLVRLQHGVLSLAQARVAGLSEDTIARRLAAKAWRRAGPRVFHVLEHDETPASRTFAAMLSVGDGAVLVGRSAAWWWDLLDAAPGRVEIAVDRDRQVRPRDGVLMSRRTVDAADRTRHRGLAVTCRAPTVLDAGVRMGLTEGARLMDRALLRRRVGLPALVSAHHRAAGRRGAPLAGELIVLAAGGARSEAERRAHRLIRDAGIRGWIANTEVVLPGYGRAVGDVVFPGDKVVLEIDGWAYHRDLRAFLTDGPRQSALAAEGWVVVRTHWHELMTDPDGFLSRLRRTLASRSGRR
ncbi:endonuclease domain-containing protein [Actinomycetospora aeridis]|uniref:DUF559 domain-containing protein n=1 Tax=Actinomycetospora aeridis TaxID=3129231 RepID=A0ABU8N0N4_9PSEU